MLHFSPDLMDSFADNVLPLFEKIHFNDENNKSLKHLRDTLLPRLLSGELAITDVDAIMGGS